MRRCFMLALVRAAHGLAAPSRNKVVFVGAGSFGSAMALVAARAQPDASIKIWARRDAVVDEINTKRRNGRYLPDDQDPFPSNVEATTDLPGAVANADVVVLAVPGEFLGTTLEQIDLDTTAVFILSDHGFKSGERRIRSEDTIDVKKAHLDHETYGIFLAAGPHIRDGAQVAGASVMDITPTR